MKKNNIRPNNNRNVNSWLKSFVKPIFTFFVVAIPSLLLWIFFSNDFPFAKHFNIQFPWWIKLLIGLALIIGSTLITLLFIYLKILSWSILTFSLPIAICFVVIFVSDSLEAWVRTLIIIPFFFLIIPIHIFVQKIEMKQLIKNSQKNNDQDKIIGHK